SRHRYAASTSGNPSFSVLRQLQYLCELTHSALHQGALLFVPALLSAASFFSNLLYFPSPKDKKITCVLQAPYTAPLFSLWLGISIAVRQITAI
ncbi:hypothetical protein P2N12_28730, partial [Klebsiella pneumoniae]|uniref:hypothetical protein n=1 Tax=Klebsiella pneumoniae TaxID=573 RepID=UPI0023DBFB11